MDFRIGSGRETDAGRWSVRKAEYSGDANPHPREDTAGRSHPPSGRRGHGNVTFRFSTVRDAPVCVRPVSNQAQTPTTERVVQVIKDTLPPVAATDSAGLIFGAGGHLDSLELVNFLADLEYRLATEFGREVVLASDRAMSRGRSPFRDVPSLAEYVMELLTE